MHLSSDQIVFWHYGWLTLNGTIVFTWALMLLLVIGSHLLRNNPKSPAFIAVGPVGIRGWQRAV